MKKYFNQKSAGVQPRTPLEVILNEVDVVVVVVVVVVVFFFFFYELPYAVCNGRVSGCCQIKFDSTNLLWNNVQLTCENKR